MGRHLYTSDRYIRVAPAVQSKIRELLKNELGEAWRLDKVEQDITPTGIHVRVVFDITIPSEGELKIRGVDMVDFIQQAMEDVKDDEALLNAGKLFEKPVAEPDDEEDDELEAFGPGRTGVE